MMKKSMDDPIKHRWREREYKFIKKHTGQLGNPKEWRIAFLPGGDAGLAPTELEIFERLGASRSNIVGIERDRETYRKLNSRKLGINLEFNDTENFFKTTDGRFHIISLDYSGQFSPAVENTLKNIAGRQLLSNRAILTTNMYGRMEGSDVKASYYAGIFTSQEALSKILNMDSIKNKLRNMMRLSMGVPPKEDHEEDKEEVENKSLRGMGGFFKEIGYEDIEKLRDRGITPRVISFLMKGKELFEINPIYLRNPHFKDIEKNLLDYYEHLIRDAKSKNQNYDLKLGDLDDLFIHMNPIGMFQHDTNLGLYLFHKGFPAELIYFALFDFSCPYFPSDVESYWYRSERGSPMYSDFFYLDQQRELIEKYHEFGEKIYRDLEDGPFTKEKLLKAYAGGLNPEDLRKLLNEYRRDVSRLERLVDRVKDENLPQRIFLGSSSQRPKLDGGTYYKLRMESAGGGQDRKELWDALKTKYKTGNGQLRAFERHFNMETYGPTKIEKSAERAPKARAYALTEMFNSDHPYGFLERLPEETKMRLGYFLGEDLPLKINLNAAEKDELLKNIAGSKWYKTAEKGDATAQQIITFFDDIMLYCVWNEKVPDKDKINELLYNSLNGGHILPERLQKPYVAEIKKGGEDMSPRGSPHISKEAAVVLLKLGHDPLELANVYSGHTPQQLRALKACNTMGKYDDAELNGELASELFGVCGLSTTDVRKAFPYLSSKKIGAYKAWDTMRSGK